MQWPDVSFNFDLSDPITIILGACVLFFLIGGILVAFGQLIGVIFFVLGFMFLGIGLVVLLGNR